MDAKLLYLAARHKLGKVTWERPGESEWVHIGIRDDFKSTELQQMVNEYYQENTLLLVLSRHLVLELPKDGIASTIKEHMNNSQMVLCDPNYRAFMEFKPVGVVRKGKTGA